MSPRVAAHHEIQNQTSEHEVQPILTTREPTPTTDTDLTDPQEHYHERQPLNSRPTLPQYLRSFREPLLTGRMRST